MTSYIPFFSGAATVAGALTGLLFVALSLAPERLRGASASVEHQSIAATAFTALVDALFVSLIGLQPGGGLEYGAIVMGALGFTSCIGLALRLWRARHTEHLSQRWPFLLTVISVIYAAQVATGLTSHTPASRADDATTFVYIMFAIGIARSWELLGLHGGGPLDLLAEQLASRRAATHPDENAPTSGDQP